MKQVKREPGELERFLRAGLLLLRFTTPWSGIKITSARYLTDQGLAYDLYKPVSVPQRTFIMIYGLTLVGERDPRLVRFARAFAASGFQVAIPDLPGLKGFRVETADLSGLVDLVCALHTANGGQIGITAFSVGAGLALTLATHPSVRDIIDPLLLFGPYYSLDELWTRWRELAHHPPLTDEEWDDYIYIWLAMTYRALGSLNLAESDKRELFDLLGNYCWESSLDRKKRIHERLVQDADLLKMQVQVLDQNNMYSLSPRGKLEHVTARVLILHDRNDHIIPAYHSERLYEGLCHRNLGGDAQQLLITSLLSHINRRLSRASLDFFRLLRILGELFR